MRGKDKTRAAPAEASTKPPKKDALACLMDGEEPDRDALMFPSEREAHGGDAGGAHASRGSGRFQEYSGDYDYGYKPSASNGDYSAHQQPQEGGAFNSVKNGATRGGMYVRDKTAAGATYMKERDWSREKEMAGKAGTATKTGAIYVGSGVAKGAGWLWKSGKSGVDNLRGTKPKE